ncbi:hypothetical protein DFR30_0106 [Thiogranum longum]|uniref:Uncharacterized protein n=1 Tax=Thiogranum longum TaxID=1537524 RepID=A0A4R1H5A0_9GAMM|nr:hypothetical protein [Thiogranum longum]TCK16887.1 hypothetical protein DFR30_0106 [Thiogranum longum]
MTTLVLQPTDLAQWHALVAEAQQACDCNLEESLESYLVFLLMRFADRPELARKIMALEFLHAQQANAQQADNLRDVGDQCLLFSGLFPQIAEKRMVRVSYFVNIGRSAYGQLSSLVDRKSERLFSNLAGGFVAIMDVLHAMRGLSGVPVLQPLAAAELWADTGSRSAWGAITEAGNLPAARRDQRSRH